MESETDKYLTPKVWEALRFQLLLILIKSDYITKCQQILHNVEMSNACARDSCNSEIYFNWIQLSSLLFLPIRCSRITVCKHALPTMQTSYVVFVAFLVSWSSFFPKPSGQDNNININNNKELSRTISVSFDLAWSVVFPSYIPGN